MFATYPIRLTTSNRIVQLLMMTIFALAFAGNVIVLNGHYKNNLQTDENVYQSLVMIFWIVLFLAFVSLYLMGLDSHGLSKPVQFIKAAMLIFLFCWTLLPLMLVLYNRGGTEQSVQQAIFINAWVSVFVSILLLSWFGLGLWKGKRLKYMPDLVSMKDIELGFQKLNCLDTLRRVNVQNPRKLEFYCAKDDDREITGNGKTFQRSAMDDPWQDVSERTTETTLKS